MIWDRCLILFLSLFPLSLALEWWNCQWFITNVSGSRSRLLFCPCQSRVEPEVGSFAYQSALHSSPPAPLSTKRTGSLALQNPGPPWLSWRLHHMAANKVWETGSDTKPSRYHRVDGSLLFHIQIAGWEQCFVCACTASPVNPAYMKTHALPAPRLPLLTGSSGDE